MSASCKDTIYVPCPVLVEHDAPGGNNADGNPHGEHTVQTQCGKDVGVVVTRYHDDPPDSYIESTCDDNHELDGRFEDEVVEKAEIIALDLPFIPYSER